MLNIVCPIISGGAVLSSASLDSVLFQATSGGWKHPGPLKCDKISSYISLHLGIHLAPLIFQGSWSLSSWPGVPQEPL